MAGDNFRYAQLQKFTLAGSGVSLGDTTMTLVSFGDIDGTAIVMATVFGAIGYGTVEPGARDQEEQISFTGVTQNVDGTATLTGVKNVGFTYPYTETSGFAKSHAGATSFVISNTSGFYNKLTSKDDDETIVGLWTFPSGANNPVIGTVYAAPTTDLQIATKKYVDDVAIAGAPDASTTTKGITKLTTAPALSTNPIAVGANDYAAAANNGITALSTAPAVASSPIAVGTNDTRVPTQGENDALVGNNTDQAVGTGNKFVTQTGLIHSAENYAASGGGTDTYTVTLSPAPTSYTAGMVVRFKADVANTGAATLNVNGLGAVAITKSNGAALVTGDIVANAVIEVVYNTTGPAFQLTTAPAAPLAWNSVATTQVLTNGAQTAFTDIDLSSVVGTNACLVVMSGQIQGAATSMLTVRRNGSAIDYPTSIADANAYGTNTIIAAGTGNITGLLIVPTDSSGVIEYKTSGTDQLANLFVLGYIK